MLGLAVAPPAGVALLLQGGSLQQHCFQLMDWVLKGGMTWAAAVHGRTAPERQICSPPQHDIKLHHFHFHFRVTAW